MASSPGSRRRRDAPRILRVDLPGHGASPVAREPFTVADLADAVLRLVDERRRGSVPRRGRLAGRRRRPRARDRPRPSACSASGCSARAHGSAPPSRGPSAPRRCAHPEPRPWSPGAPSAGSRPATWMRIPTDRAARALSTLMDVDDESYARCCEALGALRPHAALDCGAGARARRGAGAHDPVCTPALDARAGRDALPDARFVELPDASHLVPLEDPAATAALIADLW